MRRWTGLLRDWSCPPQEHADLVLVWAKGKVDRPSSKIFAVAKAIMVA